MIDVRLEIQPDAAMAQQPLQKISARLVAASAILELSSLDLQRRIDDEIDQNPALERVQIETCGVCGSELHGSICPVCIQRQKGADVTNSQVEWYDGDYVAGGAFEPDQDPLNVIATERTLGERLLDDLAALGYAGDDGIAELLVGSLDERGYLTWSVRDMAAELDVTEERVMEVLTALQSLEPVGVGSRNLRECLLIQLQFLARQGLSVPYAEEVVSDCLPELGQRRFPVIAKMLGISTSQVEAVAAFVRTKLNPHPAQGLGSTNSRDRDTRAMYVTPDVLIQRSESGFSVTVVESRRHALRVTPMYEELAGRGSNDRSLRTSDRDHVKRYVTRAKLFMTYINQRRNTLYRITCALVDLQKDFLEHGVRSLKPLSRGDVAAAVGVHESTVSRASAAKHAMLPDGRVVPFSHFFKASLSVMDVMKEIIERADRPLSDNELVHELARRDIHIARRTVAKYRNRLDILPARLR